MGAVAGAAPFQIGQTVYQPWAHTYGQKTIACPICAGNRVVVLILGSGEHVTVECQACGLGYERATGVTTVHGPDSGVYEVEVRGLEVTDDGWRVLVGGHSSARADEVFADRESAEARRVILHAEAEQQAERNFERQFKSKRKDHAWTVRYHRAEIERLERSLAWHRSKLPSAAPKGAR